MGLNRSTVTIGRLSDSVCDVKRFSSSDKFFLQPSVEVALLQMDEFLPAIWPAIWEINFGNGLAEAGVN